MMREYSNWDTQGNYVGNFGKTVPKATVDKLKAYAEKGHPLGGFLQAVVNNNLESACARADSYNVNVLAAIVMFVYNELPLGCHGNADAYECWRERRTQERKLHEVV